MIPKASGILLLLCLACSSKKPQASPPAPEPAHEHEDEREHPGLPDKVKLPAAVIGAAGIRTAAIETAVLPVTVDLTGEVSADPDASAQVSLPVAVRVVEVHFKEGQRVKAGDVLVVAESPELARARAALSGAQAKARTAAANAKRLASLAEKGLAAGQELSAAAGEAESAEAEERAARQTLTAFGAIAQSKSARLSLTAPIDGFVLSRDAVVGQNLPAEHMLARIARFERAYFLARVFEKDLGRLKQGASAEVRLNAYPDEVFVGTVETVGRQLDASARTVVARILLTDANDRLREGLFGTARIAMNEEATGPARPVVPLVAVTQIARRNVVFVQQADGDFEVHPVELGHSAGGRVEVLSGLRAGEQVVVDGVFTLKSAVLKETFGEDEH
ncbi:MAG: efflux RND transporter periplasmic adaptor subunit [Myxococcaceae bacterium]